MQRRWQMNGFESLMERYWQGTGTGTGTGRYTGLPAHRLAWDWTTNSAVTDRGPKALVMARTYLPKSRIPNCHTAVRYVCVCQCVGTALHCANHRVNSLPLHPGTTLGKWPTWRTITLYNTFIIIILYMFRATLCSSSGGQIVLIQHLV